MTDGNAVQVQQKEERDKLISQLIEVNAGRAAYYRMLGELFFRELTQEQVEHLAGMDFAGMDGDDDLIAQGYDDMRRYLRHVNSGTRQALACDYAHTFLAAGNYETFAATPFEFEFLATVIERTNAALLMGDFARARALAETVSEFHRLHQLNWIDDLCDAVLDVAETRFYRGVAKVTRGFVHMETEVVADELEVLQGLADKQAA